MASRRAALQIQTTFNILFWLGLMCDTTSSVLNDRPLAISDSDSYALGDMDLISVSTRKNAQTVTTSTENVESRYLRSAYDSYKLGCDQEPDTRLTNIWDLALMEKRHDRSSLAGAETLLQEAIPTKVLLWRRLGTLKSLIRGTTDRDTVEHSVRAALEVANFWKTKYGPFIDECIRTHHQLSFKIQSWYVILAVHFHLACLFVADCIEHIDDNCWSHTEQRSFRLNSSMTLEMTKCSVYTITNIARVCRCTPEANWTDYKPPTFNSDSHYAIYGAALLSEPWTEVLIEAFSKTFETLFDWSTWWSSKRSFSPSGVQLEWFFANIDSQDVTERCVVCADALEQLGHKSDHARRVARSMKAQLTSSTLI